jgi:hypothetical protein
MREEEIAQRELEKIPPKGRTRGEALRGSTPQAHEEVEHAVGEKQRKLLEQIEGLEKKLEEA